MPKPVCVKCQRFYRVKENGVYPLEGKPIVNGAEPGTGEPEKWAPYKIWQADLWHCLGCGHELITGFGKRPVWEDYYVSDMIEHTHKVNDC